MPDGRKGKEQMGQQKRMIESTDYQVPAIQTGDLAANLARISKISTARALAVVFGL